MTSPATEVATRLSALRLVSFVPPERDAVHVGLLSPDAREVVDLAPLGITDALEALDQLDMLRRAAGAILHGAARSAFAVDRVHLVAPVPLARSVVQLRDDPSATFADPTTLHGPGGFLDRTAAASAQVGLAAVVGAVLQPRMADDAEAIATALIGTVLVLGWTQDAPGGGAALLPGAIGPFVAVPQRRPESLMVTVVAPLGGDTVADDRRQAAAPGAAAFADLARRALASHVLRPGDLLTIFPAQDHAAARVPVAAGSWVRAAAPGLGTLSLAVR
ncbi:MAG TPA: hypothetical protein VE861_03080 [Gemmatimonadaceae bacterium]|nr:hypothetical protein [Gemmatimonadaceae bacterium]